MSSTAVAIYRSVSFAQRKTYPTMLKPFFAAALGAVIVALTVYLVIIYQAADSEQSIKKAGILIMQLEEQNSAFETQLAQQDSFLQSEEKLAMMELVKSGAISYIEKTSGVLVQR